MRQYQWTIADVVLVVVFLVAVFGAGLMVKAAREIKENSTRTFIESPADEIHLYEKPPP